MEFRVTLAADYDPGSSTAIVTGTGGLFDGISGYDPLVVFHSVGNRYTFGSSNGGIIAYYLSDTLHAVGSSDGVYFDCSDYAFAVELHGWGAGDVLKGSSKSDILAGEGGGDKLFGGRGADNLASGDGVDRLTGGYGNDSLSGGADRDVLRGGAGQDTFVFAIGDGRDRIADFQVGVDSVDLTSFGFTDFNDVLAHTFQRHGYTSIVSDTDVLVLRDIHKVDLVEGDLVL